LSILKAYKYPTHSCFDDEVISLLYLGVQRPREAMMLRAPETEALYEGSAQKGFGFLSIDGSPMPLGSLWGRWKPPMPQSQKPCGSEAKQHKQININDTQ
jgi:hypothetical protein